MRIFETWDFWLVLKLEISYYRVIIPWRILVSFLEEFFFWRLYFCMVKYLSFCKIFFFFFFFCLKIFLNLWMARPQLDTPPLVIDERLPIYDCNIRLLGWSFVLNFQWLKVLDFSKNLRYLRCICLFVSLHIFDFSYYGWIKSFLFVCVEFARPSFLG